MELPLLLLEVIQLLLLLLLMLPLLLPLLLLKLHIYLETGNSKLSERKEARDLFHNLRKKV